ncbi:MAG: hypothetical protein KAS17_04630 [Victivallaceae bacterium]|nr:hypothetical protein [Victivallaceae bacterium]
MNVELKKHNGKFEIVIDGRSFSPQAFRSFRPEERNIREFYDAGVRLMSVLHTGLNCTLDVPYSSFGEIGLGKGKYDFAAIDRKMDMFIENAPEAYFNIMLQLDTRPWYLSENPECSNTFLNLVENAGYDKWRNDVTEYLTDVIKYIEGKYGEKVFAYSFFCGGSCEWYTNSQCPGKPDGLIRNHPLKERAFREYENSEAALPSMAALEHCSHGNFRDPQKDADALRYWKFHNNIIGDTILYFASQFQNIVQHQKLLGLFYGYLLELSGKRFMHEGHMGYEKVWQSDDIDMIFAPASYGKTRNFDGPSGFLLTVDSLKLHNKLYFHEMDHRTWIAPAEVETGRKIPGWSSKPNNEFESRMILRREFALSETKCIGKWWFDFFGGYYYTKGLEEEIRLSVDVNNKIRDLPLKNITQIAFFGDVESMYYVSENCTFSFDTIHKLRDNLARCGAPYDLFNFSDLDNPNINHEQYKLYIFPNIFKLDPDKFRFIRETLERAGKTILWIYAPGIIADDKFDPANVAKTVGLEIEEQKQAETTVSILQKDILKDIPECEFGFSEELSPMFCINDPQAVVLGNFKKSGNPAVAYRSFEDHNVFYSAVGDIPNQILREIARFAGVHIYYEGYDPIFVNSRLIGIHAVNAGNIEINLPCDLEAEELFTGETLSSNHLKLAFKTAGEVKLFKTSKEIRLRA